MTSAINPNNINGAYPVAGQDNNSQGFRDNFTNTKTNFQFAAQEITALQNNAILSADLATSTTPVFNNLLTSTLSNGYLQNMYEPLVALGTTNGSVTLDYSLGSYQTVTTNGSISLGFNNFPAAGKFASIILQITVVSVAHTLTLPTAVSLGLTGVEGLNGQIITFGSIGTYQFQFTTSNGGTTVTLFDLNRPNSYYTNPVTIAANVVSNSTTTGSMVVTGGVGISGNLYVGGNISGNLIFSGPVSTTGNVTGGNILTAGIISSAGNLYVANITNSGSSGATGNITGGNLITGGLLSAAGNITGGNVLNRGQSSIAGNIIVAGVPFFTSSESLAASAAANLAVMTDYIITSSVETATLAAGQPGQLKSFVAANVTSGSMTITVTNAGWKSSGTGTIAFSSIGQGCLLQYVNSKWYAIGNNGVTFG